MKIGVFFGNPETTTGGNALKFYSSIRLDIRRVGSIKEKEQIIGNQVRVKVVKNKVAPPFRVVDFDIIYSEGISKAGEVLDMGVKLGYVEKSGAWYSIAGQKIAQGREAAKAYLKNNPKELEKIENMIRNKPEALDNLEIDLTPPEEETNVGLDD